MSQYPKKIQKISMVESDQIEISGECLEEDSSGLGLINRIVPRKQQAMRRGQIFILLLDSAYYCFGYNEVAMINPATGNPNIKEIMQLALISNASYIITNYRRSDNCENELSELEKKFYRNLYHGAKILGVKIHGSWYGTIGGMVEFKN